MTAPNKLAIINVIEDFIELKKKFIKLCSYFDSGVEIHLRLCLKSNRSKLRGGGGGGGEWVVAQLAQRRSAACQTGW